MKTLKHPHQRIDFEGYKSNVCRSLKRLGDLGFIENRGLTVLIPLGGYFIKYTTSTKRPLRALTKGALSGIFK